MPISFDASNQPVNTRLLLRREAADYLTSLGYLLGVPRLGKRGWVGEVPLFGSFVDGPFIHRVALPAGPKLGGRPLRNRTGDRGSRLGDQNETQSGGSFVSGLR